MSEKQEKSAPALSLPKGGGAIKGIGETFQPNLFSGTGNFSVPIFTSPGRGGFGPQLTLQYSTGNGNSPFGLGWSLSIPRITRKTEKGMPKYADTDVFVMSGAEDLVIADNQIDDTDHTSFQITRYRPRTEGLFARIEKWVQLDDPGSIHWRATTKENITSIYGKTAQARIMDPEHQGHIYEWLLEETFDAKGNHILYAYAKEAEALETGLIYEANRSYDSQRYIRRIFYGNTPEGIAVGPCRQATHHLDNFAATKDPIERHYLFEVVFNYAVPEQGVAPEYTAPPATGGMETTQDWSIRDDPFSSFRSGFEIRTLRRCEQVLMIHHFTELKGPTIVKSTDFTYDNDTQTRLSVLSSATLTGYRKAESTAAYTSSSMPPVTFKYSQFTPHEQRYQSITARGDDLPPLSLKDPRTTLVDIHGDGLADILHTTAAGYDCWQNLGNGELDRRHPQHALPAGITLAQPGVAFGDMGGDGMADIIVQWPEMAGFYEAAPDGNWKPFKKFETYPSFNLADPNVRLIDLTGDGRADVLMTRDMHFLWFECLGEEGYAQPRAVMRQHDPDVFPDVYFNDPAGRVRLADMTGDGLNDIVLLHNGRVDYWPNLGYGRFGKRITMQNAPRLPFDFDPARLFLSDLDGSGCADLAYVDAGQVYFWFNQSGNGWSEEQIIHGTPPVTDVDAVQFADIFGTGTATLVWSYDHGRYPGENYKALDLCGGKKPYVLCEMSNNMGATTNVHYAPSTKFYLEDKKNNTPWVTHLPFPVHVVEKVEVIDHISKTKLVTTYKYHHGYYDGREREFRGFGRVDQLDTETVDDFSSPGLHGDDKPFTNNDPAFHVPPVETRSWFHTGVYFDEDRLGKDGQPFDHHQLMEAYKQEFYAGDAQAFPMEDHLFQAHGTGNTVESAHEIFRALRGAALRTEVYARDGSGKEFHPYAVTQNRYMIKQIQAKGENPHAVYLTTQKESLSYHYERNPEDPRVGHDITLAVDDFGNVTDTIAIGYPRRKVPDELPEQGQLKMLYTKTDYINKDDGSDFRYIGVPYQRRAFEVTGYDRQWDRNRFSASDFENLKAEDRFKPYPWTRPVGYGEIEKRLVEWTRNYFRAAESNEENLITIDPRASIAHRMRLGEINSLALPYETYQAVFTSTQELQSQLQDRDADGAILFEPHFQIDEQLLKTEGGYHTGEPGVEAYWWIPSGRQNFNAAKFYLPEKFQDPFGNISMIEYDPYALLMTKTADPLNNTIKAKNNYRVLQAYALTDRNQNLSMARFDELGFVTATAVMGKHIDGNWEGDFLETGTSEPQPDKDKPTTELAYDLFRWQQGKPNYVKTRARERHQDPDTPWQVSYLYTDGFGREVQTKIQAEPGPAPKIDSQGNLVTEHAQTRWVGTGRKIYNNKGKPVKQYEPFFSHSPGYEDEAALVEWGVTPVLFYDPLERVVCTIHPNHTYEKVVFDPWHQETWDVNDTVLLLPLEDEHIKGYVSAYINNQATGYKTWYDQRIEDRDNPPPINRAAAEQRAALLTAAHAGTPTRAYLDSLGRPFLTIADNGEDQAGIRQLFKTRVKLDIEGNDLEIIDPRGIKAFAHRFDMAGRKIFVNSVDAGRSALLTDVADNPIRSRDANGNVVRTSYDELRRPKQIWVKDRQSQEYLAQKNIYGEAVANSETQNHRGQVWKVYDGAGCMENNAYDFKGNLLGSSRRLLKDARNQVQWPTDTAGELDGIAAEELLLSGDGYTSQSDYDALNRITKNKLPDATVIRPAYNEAGLLNTVNVQNRGTAEQIFVKNIDYNAKGQRTEITYGNRVKSKYTYDPDTFRLINLVATRKPEPSSEKLQHLSYSYDPVGNITQIADASVVAKPVWHAQTEIRPESRYAYDPVYRLVFAEGREHKSMTPSHYRDSSASKQSVFVEGPPNPNDTTALQMYEESYAYDRSGNIENIQHKRITNGTRGVSWTRTQTYEGSSNRIVSSKCGAEQQHLRDELFAISHDANGNMLNLQPEKRPDPFDQRERQLTWDFKNQLVSVVLDRAGNKAFYQYDASGQRVRKYIVKNGGACLEERIYLGGYEIFTKTTGLSGEVRRETIHVMDDNNRIALIENQVNSDSFVPRIRYQLNNHLGSSVLEVDETIDANVISYEEYYPYGGSSYVAGKKAVDASRKRYRYSGKERDDETGLYYYGARYYAPWMGRWVSFDPIGMKGGLNLFNFVSDNPITNIDKTGLKDSSSENIKDNSTRTINESSIDANQNDSSTPSQDLSEDIERYDVRIFFETGKDALSDRAMEKLDLFFEIYSEILKESDYYLRIEGNADSRGRASYNKELAMKRTLAVSEYLNMKLLEKYGSFEDKNIEISNGEKFASKVFHPPDRCVDIFLLDRYSPSNCGLGLGPPRKPGETTICVNNTEPSRIPIPFTLDQLAKDFEEQIKKNNVENHPIVIERQFYCLESLLSWNYLGLICKSNDFKSIQTNQERIRNFWKGRWSGRGSSSGWDGSPGSRCYDLRVFIVNDLGPSNRVAD